MEFAENTKPAVKFAPHQLCYVDFYYDRRCNIGREIIFQTIAFCGESYEGVQITHSDVQRLYRAPLVNYFTYNPFAEVKDPTELSTHIWKPRMTTAWPFLNIVRPGNTWDGLGIEFCGERIWDMFWTPEARIRASPRRCPDTAIAIPEKAVAISPDGYLLACVYSRDDSDMREEPEMYVWDLRPLVRDLLWNSRKDFVMFLVGCKYLSLQRKPDTEFVCDGISGLDLNTEAVNTTLHKGENISNSQSEEESGVVGENGTKSDSRMPELHNGAVWTASDHVFSNLELMKYLMRFL